jgi:hypothetical protein
MKLGSALPMILFGLALAGVVPANDQQAQQAFVNVAICLLAVRSGSSRVDLIFKKTIHL